MSTTNAARFVELVRYRGGSWEASRADIATALGISKDAARAATQRALALKLVRRTRRPAGQTTIWTAR